MVSKQPTKTLQVNDYTVAIADDGELSFCLTRDIALGQAAYAVMTGRGAVSTMRLLRPAIMSLIAEFGGEAYCDADKRRARLYRWLMDKAGIPYEWEPGWNVIHIKGEDE